MITFKIVSRAQVCDKTTCPICKSREVEYISCGCLCGNTCSCWSYPKCCDCNYTAGGGAGNSQGGIWIPFSDLNSNRDYTIKYQTK